MNYNKLIRDKVSEIMIEKGAVPRTHIASDDEYFQKLKEKLLEEVDEFIKEGNIEELADVLEVVYALGDFRYMNKTQLELLRLKKAEERGIFQNRIILDEIKE